MKIHILLVLSILLILGQLSAKEIVVEQPAFSVRLNDHFEIEKIVIDKKATTLHMRGYAGVLVNDIYLNVDGKEYPLQNPVNLEFGKKMEAEHAFSLVFPPIPVQTERFDLCTRAKDLMIWDIELKKPKKNSNLSTTHIPDEFIKAAIIKDDGKNLQTPQWKAADARLKGLFAGYKPEMNFSVEIITDNIITGNRQEKCLADVNDDGTFELTVPVMVTRQVLFRVISGNENKNHDDHLILLTPDEETQICFDLPAFFRKEALLRYDKQASPKILYFAGANAEINNQYYDAIFDNYSQKLNHAANNSSAIVEITASKYREHVMNIKNQCIADINGNLYLTAKVKQFFILQLDYIAANYLLMIKYNRELARLELNKEYYSFLNDLPLNDPVSLYFRNYIDVMDQCKMISMFLSRTSVADIIGVSEGLLFDLMRCQDFNGLIIRMIPLTEAHFEQLGKMKEPFLADYISSLNETLLARIEYNKSLQNHHVYDVQGKENDELFDAVIGKEKGKVVFVDFWATWCGPCISANEQLKPHKNKLNPDQVAFVFLTEESSPLETWHLMIPELSGEHYRLTRSQYDYMKRRFDVEIRTIPAYLILDKNGEKTFFQTGFPGVETILNKINEALAK